MQLLCLRKVLLPLLHCCPCSIAPCTYHTFLTNNSINWHGACCYSPIKTQSCPCLLFCTNELVIPGAAGYTWCFFVFIQNGHHFLLFLIYNCHQQRWIAFILWLKKEQNEGWKPYGGGGGGNEGSCTLLLWQKQAQDTGLLVPQLVTLSRASAVSWQTRCSVVVCKSHPLFYPREESWE